MCGYGVHVYICVNMYECIWCMCALHVCEVHGLSLHYCFGITLQETKK